MPNPRPFLIFSMTMPDDCIMTEVLFSLHIGLVKADKIKEAFSLIEKRLARGR